MISGDGDKFSSHIMRIFDSDGNGFLDFKVSILQIFYCSKKLDRFIIIDLC